MAKRVIKAADGAPPLGAYSHGWRAGDFIFVTGPGPIGPDGEVTGDSIEEQTNVTTTSRRSCAPRARRSPTSSR